MKTQALNTYKWSQVIQSLFIQRFGLVPVLAGNYGKASYLQILSSSMSAMTASCVYRHCFEARGSLSEEDENELQAFRYEL